MSFFQKLYPTSFPPVSCSFPEPCPGLQCCLYNLLEGQPENSWPLGEKCCIISNLFRYSGLHLPCFLQHVQQYAIQVLNFLAERGYNVSHAKAQVVKKKVTYLGVQITHRFRRLSSDWIQGILQLPCPKTRKQLQAFQRLMGCRIWTPNYGLIAQPLYEILKAQADSIPLMWGTP